MLEDLGPSDVREIDRIQEKSEFFILVFLLQSEKGPNPARIFEEYVLHAELENDERVRTIESCESVVPLAVGLCQAHYILHVVGYVKDIKDIVLYKIHGKLSPFDVQCGTRVVPIVESLSKNQYVSLSETVIQDPVTKEMICDVIGENVNERNPFVIKKLEKKHIVLVSGIWHKACLWIEFRRARGVEGSVLMDLRTQLARCLYYICYSLNQRDDNLSHETMLHLWEYCTNFYVKLATAIEGLLKKLLNKAARQVGDEFLVKLAAAWQKGTKKKEKKEFQNLSKMTLGTLIQCIIYWNDLSINKLIIGNKDLSRKLRKLQGCGLADFRDCFAHESEGEGASIQIHLKDKKDCKRLLASIDEGLKFLLEEKYRQ
ncbi:MAG: hypothetical protein KAV87_03735 [Desulfobacteraceae bacterium]|nr:hypothetical protein [Desulfobacteraceae bacterium]